jgi:hypothetical protein
VYLLSATKQGVMGVDKGVLGNKDFLVSVV